MKIINNSIADITDKTNTTNDASGTIWEKIGEICLYLLVGLTPLFFLPLTTAPVEINKQIFAGLLVLIAFICYLINSLKKGNIVYPASPLSLAIAILLAVVGISTVFSQARGVSLYGNFIQSDSLMSFLIYGLAFFTAAVFYPVKSKVFNSEENSLSSNRVNRLEFFFFGGLALTVILGLVQIFGQKIGLIGGLFEFIGFNTIGSLLSWAIYSSFGLIVIIAKISNWEGPIRNFVFKKQTGLLAGLGLLIVLALFLLNYSVIWLTLALTTLLLAAYKFIALSKLNPVLIIIINVFLFFALIGQSLPSLVSLPVEIRPNLSTTLTVFKESLDPIRIFIGSGPATFGYNYALHRPILLNQTDFWSIRFNQGFSFLTTLLTTVGILGVLAILFLVFCFIRQARQILWKNSSFRGRGGPAEQAGPIALGTLFLLISWLFAPNFFTQGLFIFLGLGLITALSNSVKEISLANFSKPRAFIFFIVLIILITVSFALMFSTMKKYLGLVYHAQAIQFSRVGDLNNALTKLDRAIGLDPGQDQYFRDLSQLLLVRIDTLARQGEEGALVEDLQLEIQNTTAAAIQAALRAVEINPIDSFNWSNLGNVYERLIPIAEGADSFAKENYRKAMALDPNNPQEPVNLARTLIASADQSQARNETELWEQKLNEAKGVLEKSIGLKADYAPAHFLLAVIAMREGKTQEAIARLELTRGIAPFDAGLAFQLGVVYYHDNQLEKAQSEFERAVGIDANHSNARYFLGLIYDRLGNKSAALEQFKKIAELNPDNAEVKKIIENLQNNRAALDGIVPPDQPPAERLEAPVRD